jgi:Uma2 family endonuclease
MATLDKETLLPSMTFEEFLNWSNEDTRAEWVDGRVEILMPVSYGHLAITRFLIIVLGYFLNVRKMGVLIHSPFLMRLSSRPSGREPDVAVVLNAHRDRIYSTFIDGPADIVVEVISPESRERDRIEKYREYAMASIPEYWLIDPALKTAEFFKLREGVYEPSSIDAEGRFWSDALPGFWMMVNWLWEEPSLPEILQAWENGPTREVAFASDEEGYLIYPPSESGIKDRRFK